MIDNQRSLPPPKPENTVRVRFNRSWKYSPRGWDMVKVRKGDELDVPEFIAKIASEDLDGSRTPAAEILGDAEDRDRAAPEETAKPAKGRGR